MAESHFAEGRHDCAFFQSCDQGATQKDFRKCTLNPGHKEFMTVEEFQKKTPSEIGLCDDDMAQARNQIDRTVRVVSRYTSADRPDTYKNSKNPYPCIEMRGYHNWVRYGSGYLVERYTSEIGVMCPCPECKTLTSQMMKRKSYFFVIKTATHVVFDEQEARNTVFEFFFDTEVRDKVKNVYGVTVLGSELFRLETDLCCVVCVTHDSSLAENLLGLLGGECTETNRWILVSHPHGVSKRISIGDAVHSCYAVIPNEKYANHKKPKSLRIRVSSLYRRDYINHEQLQKNSPLLICGFDDQSEKGTLCDVRYIRSYRTTLVRSNGKRIVEFDIRFDDYHYEAYFLNNKYVHYFLYNMASCPGSSGAHVYAPELCEILIILRKYKLSACPRSSGASVYESKEADVLNFLRERKIKQIAVHFGTSEKFRTSSLITSTSVGLSHHVNFIAQFVQN